MLLIDPEWSDAADDDTPPPAEAVLGEWAEGPDGALGPFRPNPGYRPRFENSPVDPLDAVIRLAMHGDAELDQVLTMLGGSLVEMAFNGDGRPLLAHSPDDRLCVLIASSPAHRRQLFAPRWREVTLADLLAALPDDADVLVNPGAPAWVRLAGDFIRTAS